ncbi:hypothetical protein SCTVLC_0057 [Serratia symbiotica SCt-VLC]|uniref:Uncharacterized protein n=1 Tax=Serratia symbiotica SCt-VLC TaxID=1347341 RepID=A0A068R9C1_9GAMM|nr:hypothetical protein SCTVLC_0057 [Serratia symbiotica SCt-VLC]
MGRNEFLGEESVGHKVSKDRDHLRCIINKKPRDYFRAVSSPLDLFHYAI